MAEIIVLMMTSSMSFHILVTSYPFSDKYLFIVMILLQWEIYFDENVLFMKNGCYMPDETVTTYKKVLSELQQILEIWYSWKKKNVGTLLRQKWPHECRTSFDDDISQIYEHKWKLISTNYLSWKVADCT